MPKFISKCVNVEVKNPDGSTSKPGVTAWIPVNDAAKASKVLDKAIQLGIYKPSDPNERENMEKKLKERQIEDLKRKGMIPRT